MTVALVLDHIRLLRDLRSVRRFRLDPVPDHVVADVLEVARWSGSGQNRQPWELILVRDRTTLRALAHAGDSPGSAHVAGAPLGIAVVLSHSSQFDEGRLCERIMLSAAAHGCGSSIAGFRGAGPVAAAKEILRVPVELTLRTAISIGYPADERARLVSTE